MSGALTLMSLTPDLRGLSEAAARAGLLPPGGDLGYALHAALLALFGRELAPKPFVLRQDRLLGYSRATLKALRQAAALPAFDNPELAASLRPDTLDARVMPDVFVAGQTLDGEVRVRPVVRTRTGREGPHRERDVFLQHIDPSTPPPDVRASHAARAEAYAAWLAHEVGRDGAARLDAAELVGFRRTRLYTGREGRGVEGPDAVLRARLTILDPAAFAKLASRGVGRVRSFGFGMLLLAPPGRLLVR